MGSELGTGGGPLAPLIAVARGFKALGHRPVFVIRDAAQPALWLTREGFHTLQAPVWRPGAEVPEGVGYGTLLRAVGFADPERIGAVTGRWRQLIDHLEPAVVVAHMSPGLCLATRGRVPAVAIGDGFAVPPTHLESFPPLAAKGRADGQADLLAAANAAQAARGAPPLARLPELMEADGAFPCVLPDLDPYQDRRASPALGPPEPLPPATPAEARHAYVDLVAHFYDADAVLTAIAQRGLTATAHVRGVSSDFMGEFQWPGVELVTRPPAAEAAVAGAALVVHNGYLPLTTLCLAIGRPQIIIPDGREAGFTARRAAALGLAWVIEGEATAEGVAKLIDAALAARPQAYGYARALDRAALGNAQVRVVERALDLMAGDGE
jgi:UDP:flavonoid glycosyltransferase YjiC (YdhE family)